MLFADRAEAGRALVARLRHLKTQRPVVLARPRGGVPVGFEVAWALKASLDLVFVRKIEAPGQPEFAIDAIADGAEPELVVDPQLVHLLHISDDYLEPVRAEELSEIKRRRTAPLSDRPRIDVRRRAAIVVDDGITGGSTMRAALRVTRCGGPARLIMAVPAAPPRTSRDMSSKADAVICLHTPSDFIAVGQFYRSVPRFGDKEMTSLLTSSASHGMTPEGTGNARRSATNT